MNRNQQSGFILMIVIMVAILLFVVGFAVFRIMDANSDDDNPGYRLDKSIGQIEYPEV